MRDEQSVMDFGLPAVDENGPAGRTPIEPGLTGIQILRIVMFFAIICGPLAAMPFGWGRRSGAADSEQRAAVPFPKWSWRFRDLIVYPRQFEAWFRDHFGFRQTLIDLNSRISYFVFHTSPSAKVLLGRDGWLFYNGDKQAGDSNPVDDSRGATRLPPRQLEWIRWMIQDQLEWLAARGIRYHFIVIPSKEAIYAEYLPDYAAKVGPSPREQVLAHLRTAGVPALDLMEALRAGKARDRLFMKTDSHWNDLGALIGYQQIIAAVASNFPAVRPLTEADFRVERRLEDGSDLARMINLNRELREEQIYLAPRAERQSRVRKAGLQEMVDVYAETDDASLPVGVVYRDSFTERLVPFLSENFKRLVFKWARQGADMSRLDAAQPDVVLQIMADRALSLPLKYSGAIQAERARQRFGESRIMLLKLTATNRLAGVERVLELPEIKGADRYLPIVRLEIGSPGEMRMSLQALRPGARGRLQWTEQVGAALASGDNDICLPLVDPELSGPLRLVLTGAPGDCVVKSVEVRGIRRF